MTTTIDEYFDFKLGKLEWRTVSFEEEVIDMLNYQGNAVMNFIERDDMAPIVEKVLGMEIA